MITTLIVDKNTNLVVSYLVMHIQYVLDEIASRSFYCIYRDGKISLDFSNYTYSIDSAGKLNESLKEV